MKATSKIFVLFVALHAVLWTAPQRLSAQVSVSFQVFYDDLSPYGNWVDNSDYGYVWVPRVSRGFSPYSTNGYWVFTDEGWTWVSNYSWGWAPFHYGRWFYDSYYRWIWVPDNEWGPGWVSWRRSDSYYGWAPLGPGISIDIAYSNGYNLPYNQWTFVRNRDFGRTNINNYYVNSSNNTTIINNTTVINNIRSARSNNVRYNAGPDRREVEQRAGKQFAPVVLKERNRPGYNLARGELQIYRPQVEKNVSRDRGPVPSKVGGWKNVRPEVQRNNAAQPQKENQPSRVQPSQGQGNSRPIKQQPSQPQRSDQQTRQPLPEQRRNDQQTRQPLPEQRRNDQRTRQPLPEQKRNDQPVRQSPQQKRDEQPARQQPPQQRQDQRAKEPQQQKHDEQPAKQPPQQKRDNPPKKDQPRKSD